MRPVRIWLGVMACLVVLMVLVGGATRLTDSGLSITEWKPVTGIVPPLSAGDWEAEFEKYRQIPEYAEINSGMSLSEFKFIYWWEWGHRFLGRFVGLAFLIPFLGLLVSGHIRKPLIPRLLLLFVLGGLQGVVGWWMVKSGLSGRTDVSQYRLAVHLSLACIILAALIWTIFSLSDRAGEPRSKPVRAGAWLVLGLVFVQIGLGAVVAGLDAGLTYNTWPLMDGDFIPKGLWSLEPVWLNMTENIATVQFDHRIVAYLLCAVVLVHAWQLSAAGSGGRALLLGFVVLLQVLVGIATLIHVVPISLGLIHQFTALVVLAIAVWNVQQCRGRDRLIDA